jgi:hypothetical protein
MKEASQQMQPALAVDRRRGIDGAAAAAARIADLALAHALHAQ